MLAFLSCTQTVIQVVFLVFFFFFFFSSRRRHTRFKCDWSSDVCSSDLMKRVLSKKRIVFRFLEPVRRAGTFLVPKRHVTRNRFAKRFRFGAFENDDFLCHRCYSLDSAAGAASSSSPSPPSSSVRPKSEVTDCRTREALFCFSSCD